MEKIKDIFNTGIWYNNPTFRMLLGMCPTLAITTLAVNGLAMGLSTLFVLLGSEIITSLLRKFVPHKIRIPIYIVIVATFVTVVDYFLAAFFPPLYAVLGIFIPLIVVNCIILGRVEAFSSQNTVFYSIIDALGMGLGFTWALTLLSSIRELIGFGTIFGYTLLSTSWYTPIVIISLPTGAFLTLGLMIAGMNYISSLKVSAAAQPQEKVGDA